VQLNLVIDSKASTFEEASKHKVWKDDMIEEYESILKNDVWEVVPRSGQNKACNKSQC
jgi:hypothetical protein